jgi:shikimate dehydrogenase
MKLVCGLIGDHIENSRFGAGLSRVGAEHGVEVAFEHIDTAHIPDFDFRATVARLRDQGWTGVTVTHPYKTDAMALADTRRGVPDRLASSNLLLFGDVMEATNTDYVGFQNMWAEAGVGTPGRVAMAGAGGVARSIATALDELGASEVIVWDPRPGAAPALAREVGGVVHAVLPQDAPALIAAADGLVNATPLGMVAHPGSAFERSALGPQGWAFDAVYAPAPTRFAEDAREAGIRCLTGHDLFRHMLLGSFEAYSGIKPDASAMFPVLKALTEGAR